VPDEGADPTASGERRRAASSAAGTKKGDRGNAAAGMDNY